MTEGGTVVRGGQGMGNLESHEEKQSACQKPVNQIQNDQSPEGQRFVFHPVAPPPQGPSNLSTQSFPPQGMHPAMGPTIPPLFRWLPPPLRPPNPTPESQPSFPPSPMVAPSHASDYQGSPDQGHDFPSSLSLPERTCKASVPGTRRPRSFDERSELGDERELFPMADQEGRQFTDRERLVVSSVLEKSLVNLCVLSELKVGDKLGRDDHGNFMIMKPSWRTTAERTTKNMNRFQTLEQIKDLIGSTENSIREAAFNDPRIRPSLINAIHGLRNLQKTYQEDALFKSGIEVLLHRVEYRYNLKKTQMI